VPTGALPDAEFPKPVDTSPPGGYQGVFSRRMDTERTAQGTAGEIPSPDMKVVEEMQQGIVAGFLDVQQAKAEGKPVVWTSVLLPREIFQAMDVAAVYGNVLGSYASIFGLSAKYCQLAEESGLSRDVCAVHRCMLGLAVCDEREELFDLAFAKPDIAIGSNFPCMSESKSFLLVADRYRLPTYFVDTPLGPGGRGRPAPDHAVAYYVAQLRGMIDFLVSHGHRFDMERLKEEVAFTKALNTLFEEIDRYKMAVPLPIKAYDNVIAATAPLVLPKRLRTMAIFERLRDELRERVEKGVGVVPDEKLRLLWIGMPPLCDFKLLDYPERRGAVVAKSMLEFLTGFNLDPRLMDPEKPLESIARAQLASPANPPLGAMIDYFVQATKDYRIDGVVSVVKRTCGIIPGIQRLNKEAIREATGVPSIVFDLDGVDAREYDAAATKASLDAFIDVLLARKGAA